MSSEEKLAYVARLLRSLALSYGVSAEFGGGRGELVGEAHEQSPAALLRGLNHRPRRPSYAILEERKRPSGVLMDGC
jgi:hypothetical protein